ncbi:tetratricopeptide repeat protein [Aquabacterium sp.]|uniref:tetratricopeptide repeat protein n=1 Tax=Aquabacterium sp. TaxID=1872578 RepID=UPI0035B2CEC7
MSVINRMLQDLDARGAAQPDTTAAPAAKRVDIPDLPYRVRARQRRRPMSWRVKATAMLALLACAYAATPRHAIDGGWQRVNLQLSAFWHPVPAEQPAARPVVVASVQPAPAAVAPAAVETRRNGLVMDGALSALAGPARVRHIPKVPAAPPAARAEVLPAAVPVGATAGNERRFTMIDPPAAGAATSPVARAAQAYHRALDLSDEGRDTAALEAALDALRIDPQHGAARRLAASLALNLNRVDQAGALIDEGLKANPNDAELQYQRARALVVSGLNEQALAELQGQTRPTADALGLKAGLLAHEGQYPQAARAYELALREQPSNATWWLGLGVACDAQGQSAAARNALNRARALGTLRPDLQNWVEQKLATIN